MLVARLTPEIRGHQANAICREGNERLEAMAEEAFLRNARHDSVSLHD